MLVRKIFLFSFLLFSIFQKGELLAQEDNSKLMEDTKTDFLIVVGGGAAGGILGLSTLSFVDKPSRHTRNVLVGAALGIVAGVAVVVYNRANETSQSVYESSSSFNTNERSLWHEREFFSHVSKDQDLSLTLASIKF